MSIPIDHEARVVDADHGPVPSAVVIDERVAHVIAACAVAGVPGVLLFGWWPALVPLAVDVLLRARGRSG